MSNATIISDLRARIKDTRYNHRALSLSVTDDRVTRAVAEVSSGHLIVTTVGGLRPTVDLDLSQSRYSSIHGLYQALLRMEGFGVSLDEDADTDHDSLDIEPMSPVDIGPEHSALTLKTRLFSDRELEVILRDATSRHNPSLSLVNLPDAEVAFVLVLAHAEVCRRQAYDVAKRRGLDTDVNNLLQIASSLEASYEKDTRRLKRALSSPREATPNSMGQGDVVLGTFFRRSPRTGRNAPMSANLAPTNVILLEPDNPMEIEDDNVTVSWQRNKDVDFYSYELWMDSVPDVMRATGSYGMLPATPYSARDQLPGNIDPRNRGVARPTTSKMVFRSFGANSNANRATFHTFVAEYGQLITSFNVGLLEPNTEYYFRLYVSDLNYEATPSNVVCFKTKPRRTRFSDTTYASPLTGVAGTQVTLYFNNKYAPITADCAISIGEYTVAHTVLSAYSARIVVPAFTVLTLPKDLVVCSPSGLKDIRAGAFTVTE